jgi:hypothetical protein
MQGNQRAPSQADSDDINARGSELQMADEAMS